MGDSQNDLLEDQIFTGPLLMMLKYKRTSLEDPQVQDWLRRKRKGRQYYRTRLDNDLSIGLEQGRIKHKQQYRHRSTRIIRSLAKKLQLNGQECWDSTRTREFCLFVYDYLKEISPYFLIRAGIRMGNEQRAFTDYLQPALEYFLPVIRSSLHCKSGFILRSGFSYIDIVIAEQLYKIYKVAPYLLIEEYPGLLEYQKRVYSMITDTE